MSPDNTAPISSIRRQHVSTSTAIYMYNSLCFPIRIYRLVEGPHKTHWCLLCSHRGKKVENELQVCTLLSPKNMPRPYELRKLCLFIQNFDRELCCRQLRYSGMMETIRIRRAGYPIRHKFSDFVDRYRILVRDVGPSHTVECKAASNKICKAILGQADYQMGKTKVFLKVGGKYFEFLIL